MPLFLTGNVLNLVGAESLQLEIKETFYARCVEGKPLFSLDLINWKPFRELVTGKVSVALDNQDGEVFLSAGADVNLR